MSRAREYPARVLKLQTFLRLLCVWALLLTSQLASAHTSVHPETRVGAFEVAAQSCVQLSVLANSSGHQENADASTAEASGYPHATKGAGTAARGAGSATQKQLGKFGKQLQEHGRRSVERSQRKITRRLNEHRNKLEQIRRDGGHASSVEREIRNFERELEAIDEVLRGSP